MAGMAVSFASKGGAGMNTNKFDCGKHEFFGVGIYVQRWNSGWLITLALPFVWVQYCTDPT